jgi:Bacterial dnaA protein helix-turn-helix
MTVEWRARRRSADEALAGLSMGLTSFAMDVPVPDIAAATRGSAQSALARQVAMYLCHVAGGLSLSRVAEVFGRDRSTIAYACHAIEDRRDDAAFDAWIACLEQAMRAAPPPAGFAPAGSAAFEFAP